MGKETTISRSKIGIKPDFLEEISSCRKCSFRDDAYPPLPPVSAPVPVKLLLIGENPSWAEEQQTPFDPRTISGQALDRNYLQLLGWSALRSGLQIFSSAATQRRSTGRSENTTEKSKPLQTHVPGNGSSKNCATQAPRSSLPSQIAKCIRDCGAYLICTPPQGFKRQWGTPGRSNQERWRRFCSL